MSTCDSDGFSIRDWQSTDDDQPQMYQDAVPDDDGMIRVSRGDVDTDAGDDAAVPAPVVYRPLVYDSAMRVGGGVAVVEHPDTDEIGQPRCVGCVWQVTLGGCTRDKTLGKIAEIYASLCASTDSREMPMQLESNFRLLQEQAVMKRQGQRAEPRNERDMHALSRCMDDTALEAAERKATEHGHAPGDDWVDVEWIGVVILQHFREHRGLDNVDTDTQQMAAQYREVAGLLRNHMTTIVNGQVELNMQAIAEWRRIQNDSWHMAHSAQRTQMHIKPYDK